VLDWTTTRLVPGRSPMSTRRRAIAYGDLSPSDRQAYASAGPIGSGKTTMLATTLSILNEPTRKILTIEDPVEYENPRDPSIAGQTIDRTDLCASQCGFQLPRPPVTWVRQSTGRLALPRRADADGLPLCCSAANQIGGSHHTWSSKARNPG
jgi:energy-coupling factor transporter ATP-binding protein EcfA2